MKLKTKSARRLLVLGVVLTLILAGVVGAVFVRSYRNNARVAERRERGFQAVAARDDAQTLNNLGPYLRAHPEDAEALIAYARARKGIEERGGRHLAEAAAIYQRYLTIKPEDDAARRELFDTFASAGLDVELIDLAKKMRPADLAQVTDKHLDVAREELTARQRRRDFGPDTIALARRLTEVAPADFAISALYITALLGAERADEARAFVAAIEKERPDDPRVSLLLSITGDQRALNPSWLLERLTAAAGINPADGARVSPPVDLTPATLLAITVGLDGLGRPDLGRAALEPLVDKGDVDAARFWARRCWYLGDDARLLAHDTQNPAWQDPDVVAFRALSMLRTGRGPESAALFATLKRPDYRSTSWAAAAPGFSAADRSAAITAFKAGIERNPAEPVFRVSLGERLLAAGQVDDGRRELNAATNSPLIAGWAAPWTILADTYLADGRPAEAERVAVRGLISHPRDPRLNMITLVSKIDQVERGQVDRDGAQRLLERLDAIAAQWATDTTSVPGGETLQWFILGRAVCADAVQDRERLGKALDDAAAMSSTLRPNIITRLAAISARNKMGREGVFESAVNAGGDTPDATFTRAMLQYAKGSADEARALVDKALADPAHTGPSWALLRPRTLDAIGDPGAAAAWAAYADAYPDDPEVQLTALESPTVAKDADLVAKLITRISARTAANGGTLPLRVRLAQARSLLVQPPSVHNRDRLIGTLRPITAEAPELAEPKLMLADAFLMEIPDGPPPETGPAVEQLRAAIPLSTNGSAIRTRLAALMLRSGDTQAAARELVAITNDPRAPAGARWTAASDLARLGQFEPAAATVAALTQGDAPLTTEQAVLAARILSLAGNQERAVALLNRLKPEGLNPDETLEVATAWASVGNVESAKKVIERASTAAADRAPFDRARVRFETRFAPTDAVASAAALCKTNPGDAENHKLLIAAHLALGQTDLAQAALAEALRLHPRDPDLELQRVQLALAGGSQSEVPLKDLATALEAKPELKRRARAVRELIALQEQGKDNDPVAIAALVQNYPDEPTVASFAVRALLKLGRAAQAADIASAALRRFPTRPETASDAYGAASEAARWEDALIAADVWQRTSRSMDADIAVAQANLRLDRPRLARAALERHVEHAARDPQRSIVIIAMWARLQITPRTAADARRYLEPIASSNATIVKGVWIPLAAELVPVTEAPEWLERARTWVASDPDGRLAVGAAWATLAERAPPQRAVFLKNAIADLDAAVAQKPSPQAQLILGRAAGAAGDFPRAERSFRSAAESPETKSEGLVGLARVAMAQHKLDDAITLARQSVEVARPGEIAAHFTLAECLHTRAAPQPPSPQRTADITEAALAAERAIKENPSSVDAISLAAMLRASVNQPDQAIAHYERLLTVPGLPEAARASAQNNCAYLLITARTDPASITRALELVRSACKLQPSGPTFDTLGACELAGGDRPAALAAFRRSLELRPGDASTLSKLAEGLAGGSSIERAESSQVLDQAEKAAAAKNNPETSARIARVRQVLSAAPPR